MAVFFLFILILLLVIFLSIVSFGLNIIRGVLSLFFPSLRRKEHAFYGNTNERSGSRDFEPESGGGKTKEKKKIFDRSEGEYVDYEEVSK